MWHALEPPIELTSRETKLCARMQKQRRFFRFLRLHRHRLFDAAFQDELATMYADTPRGTPPKPPALLAAAVLLQAYTRTSDFDAVQATETDARWQMVLDCLGVEDAPFGETTLVDFRTRLVNTGLYQALLRRMVDLAKETRDFGYKQAAGLRVAIDSAPLAGAGKVEDTINLLGHALRLLMLGAVSVVIVNAPLWLARVHVLRRENGRKERMSAVYPCIEDADGDSVLRRSLCSRREVTGPGSLLHRRLPCEEAPDAGSASSSSVQKLSATARRISSMLSTSAWFFGLPLFLTFSVKYFSIRVTKKVIFPCGT